MAKTYQKIPGIGTGRGSLQVASRSRIYTAPDHLLVMQSTGYTEEYKRIFFRDIRFVDVRKTNGQIRIAVISGILTLLFALPYLAVHSLAVTIFCVPFLVWFIVNLLTGPTCECYVGTNVQTLKLPAPQRMVRVATLIEFLRAKAAEYDSVNASQPAG